MNIELLEFTLDVIGKNFGRLYGHYGALRFWKEHKIDGAVFATMEREMTIAVLGVVLIVIGYVLQIPSKL